MIIVDVTVANCQIRVEKPAQEYQNMPMPNTDVGKVIWFESGSLPPDRLNKRQFGHLSYLTPPTFNWSGRLILSLARGKNISLN